MSFFAHDNAFVRLTALLIARCFTGSSENRRLFVELLSGAQRSGDHKVG